MVDSYLRLYNASTPDWEEVAAISTFLGFDHITNVTTDAYLKSEGVGERYIAEMVECTWCMRTYNYFH